MINSVIERKLVTDHQWLFPWKNAFVISHSGKRVQHKTSYPVTLLLTDLLHLQGNSGPVLGWTRYTSYQSSAYTQTYCMQCLPVITSYSDDDDDFYIVFSALEQTHCIFVACDSKSDSQQKADPGEKKKSPATSAKTRTCDLPITSPVLYPRSYPRSLKQLAKILALISNCLRIFYIHYQKHTGPTWYSSLQSLSQVQDIKTVSPGSLPPPPPPPSPFLPHK